MLVSKHSNVITITDDTDTAVTVPHDALGYVIESLVYEYILDYVQCNGPTSGFYLNIGLLTMVKNTTALAVKAGDLEYNDAGNLASTLQKD